MPRGGRMAPPGKSSPVQQNKKVSEKAERGTPRSWGVWRVEVWLGPSRLFAECKIGVTWVGADFK
jgi:hypothetical protein